MRVPFLDLQAQISELGVELEQTVLDVLRGGAYVVGRHNKGLEEEIAAWHGCKHGIAVNSGTDALRIMLQACDIGPGDEVITTAFTFVASIEVILQLGAKPVLVDIEPDAFMIDPGAVEAAITPRTKAIMPVHLFGQLCEMAPLQRIAVEHGLLVLEDAAQAIDSHCNGAYAGQFGQAAGISFYVTKNLGAAGDGGLILTNDDEVDRRSRSLRIHGMGRERYYYDEIGYTSRMAELQAAILRLKLKPLRAWHDRRAELAKIYDRMLSGELRVPRVLDGNNHTYHQYTIRAKRRDALQAFLKEREVDSMVYYPVPLHFHAPYRHLAEGEGSLPQTELAAKEVLSLPIHQYLRDDQVEFVSGCILEFCKSGVPA